MIYKVRDFSLTFFDLGFIALLKMQFLKELNNKKCIFKNNLHFNKCKLLYLYNKSLIMKALYQKFEILLQNTTTRFKRYLYDEVAWESRMVGIIGARGVGKTTMLLQYIKQNLDTKKALYVSADDMYFAENKLVDLVDKFYKNAGEYLYIDEIHK
jgi:hypothetical protein